MDGWTRKTVYIWLSRSRHDGLVSSVRLYLWDEFKGACRGEGNSMYILNVEFEDEMNVRTNENIWCDCEVLRSFKMYTYERTNVPIVSLHVKSFSVINFAIIHTSIHTQHQTQIIHKYQCIIAMNNESPTSSNRIMKSLTIYICISIYNHTAERNDCSQAYKSVHVCVYVSRYVYSTQKLMPIPNRENNPPFPWSYSYTPIPIYIYTLCTYIRGWSMKISRTAEWSCCSCCCCYIAIYSRRRVYDVILADGRFAVNLISRVSWALLSLTPPT